jgi:hypothetical protein
LNSEGGSTTSNWRTLKPPIRTAAELPIHFNLVNATRPPLYLQILEKVMKLRRLGMNANAMARGLGVSDKTVTKVLNYAKKGDG